MLSDYINDGILFLFSFIFVHLYRLESHGKAILQRQQLLAEFESATKAGVQRLAEGVFGEVIRSTQVHCKPTKAFCTSSKFTHFQSLTFSFI